MIIPVYNNAAELHSNLPALITWLHLSGMQYEIILVNDGGDAENAELLSRLEQKNTGIRLVSHAQNRGQQLALATGFRVARGDVAITTDADFVVPPQGFTQLLQYAAKGHDLVLGQRASYRRMSWYRSAGALAVRLLIAALYRFKIRDFGCGTNAVRRSLLDRFLQSEIPSDVIKLTMLALSENPVEVPLDCGGYRQSGSSYSLMRLAMLLVRIISFRWRARRYFVP